MQSRSYRKRSFSTEKRYVCNQTRSVFSGPRADIFFFFRFLSKNTSWLSATCCWRMWNIPFWWACTTPSRPQTSCILSWISSTEGKWVVSHELKKKKKISWWWKKENTQLLSEEFDSVSQIVASPRTPHTHPPCIKKINPVPWFDLKQYVYLHFYLVFK